MAEPNPILTDAEAGADPTVGAPRAPALTQGDQARGAAFLLGGGDGVKRLDEDYVQALEVRRQAQGAQFLLGDQAQQQEASPDYGSFKVFGADVPYPTTLRGLGETAGAVGRDVGGALGDAAAMAGGVPKGLRAAVRSYEELSQPLVDWLEKNVGGLGPNAVPKPSDLVPNPWGIADREAQTVTGGLGQGIIQFLTGFGIAGKAIQGGGALATIGKGLVSDFAFFDGVEKNFADLVRMLPDAQRNEVLAYLAEKKDDEPVVNRMKNALSGVIPNALLEPVMMGLRAYKQARVAKGLAEQSGADAAKVADQAAGGPGVTPGRTAEELLGGPGAKPDDPLLKFQVDTGVPDQFAATGLVRTATEGEAPGAAGATDRPSITVPEAPAGAREVPRAQHERVAAAIGEQLPPVPDGMVRLWRGNRPDEVGQNPSFTNDLAGIALPFQKEYGGPLSYVDVPAKDVEKFVSTGAAAPGAEFMLPKELAATAKAVELRAAQKATPVSIRVYHGSNASRGGGDYIPSTEGVAAQTNDIGVHFGTRQQAEKVGTIGKGGRTVGEFDLNLKKVLDVTDGYGSWGTTSPAETLDQLRFAAENGKATFSVADVEAVYPKISKMIEAEKAAEAMAALRKFLTDNGYDGLRYWNKADGEGWSYIALKNDAIARASDNIANAKAPGTIDAGGAKPPGGSPPGGGGDGMPPGSGMPGAGPAGYTGRPYINWLRISSTDDIKSVLGQMASAMVDQIDQTRRGVRTNAETMKAAGDESAWGVLMARRKGEVPNAEQQLALRQLWAASGEKVLEVARAAATGDGEAAIAFRRMLAIHNLVQNEVIAIRTETARALQQWRIPAGSGAERLRELDTILRQAGGIDVSQGLASAVLDLAARPNGVAKVDELVRRSAFVKSAETLIEVWKAGLLWGPHTHIVNAMSNSLVVPLSIIERAASGAVSEFTNPVAGVKAGEASMMLWGMTTHLKSALRQFAQAVRANEQAFGGGQAEAAPVSKLSSEFWNVSSNSVAGRGLDMLGQAYTLPFRMLGASDAFFKELHYGAELQASALRQATEELMRGQITKDQLKPRVAELANSPTDMIRLQARDFAEYNTFTNDPGAFAKAIMKVREADNPVLRVMAHVALPFVQTPANIARFTFERTPLGGRCAPRAPRVGPRG